jgi:glycosyltransferase involved in cell wall biosynthesis
MRILFLNYEYPPLGGGAANATAYILEEYAKIPELEVDLVTSSTDNQYHLNKIGNNINIHKLPIGKNAGNLHFQSQKDLLVYAGKAYFFSRKLIRQLAEKNIKYDLSHSFFTVPCGFISLLLKWQHNIPYVVSLRGSDVPGYSDRFVFLYGLLKPLIKLIWKKSSAVIANSTGLRELAQKTNSKQKIGVIYNGIDTNNFKPSPEVKPVNKFILTTGASRITTRKGIDYLIQAIKQLSLQYPQLLLRAMGEGDAKESLKKLARDLKIEKNVEFIGRIPREKTAPFYQEASLFILPSLNEGMSNAMLEALSSGLPLLATDTGGTKEILEDGENGFIIKMKNASDIAEKIKKLMDDSELREKMAEISRKKALEMSWEKIAKEYLNLYKNIK